MAGSKSGRNSEQLPKVAAQLQGLHMGLLAAQQLAFHSIIVQALNSRPLLQVNARAMNAVVSWPCSPCPACISTVPLLPKFFVPPLCTCEGNVGPCLTVSHSPWFVTYVSHLQQLTKSAEMHPLYQSRQLYAPQIASGWTGAEDTPDGIDSPSS